MRGGMKKRRIREGQRDLVLLEDTRFFGLSSEIARGLLIDRRGCNPTAVNLSAAADGSTGSSRVYYGVLYNFVQNFSLLLD